MGSLAAPLRSWPALHDGGLLSPLVFASLFPLSLPLVAFLLVVVVALWQRLSLLTTLQTIVCVQSFDTLTTSTLFTAGSTTFSVFSIFLFVFYSICPTSNLWP